MLHKNDLRKQIFISDEKTCHYDNYYSLSNFKKIITKDSYNLLIQHTKTILENYTISSKSKKDLKFLISAIPQHPFYDEDEIEKANVLLISNEPGWSKKSDQLYQDINNIKTKYGYRKILKLFSKSMQSWLSMTPFDKTGSVNGINSKIDTVNRKLIFKDYGVLSYFLRNGDDFFSNEQTKAIHIDFLPFAQTNNTDTNKYNDRDILYKSIKYIYHIAKGAKSIEDLADIFNLSDKKTLRLDWLPLATTCYNIYLINKFYYSTKKRKFIFVIGNRCINSDYCIPEKYNKTKNNSSLLYHYLTGLHGNSKCHIRLTESWPNGLKGYPTFKPVPCVNDLIYCHLNRK